MASPQKEDGYTPIANELFEAIISNDFSKRQLLVIMAIARMTYGYSKKTDALSGWQISKLTKLDRSSVSKTINELIQINVINKHENGRESHGILVQELSINKDYQLWITVDDSYTVDKLSTVDKTSTVTVDKTSIEPLIKHPTHKAIQKQENKYTSEFDEFWISYPKKEAKKTALKTWLKIKPNLNDILIALSWQKKTLGWINGFIPLPTTYLNQERWKDEPANSNQQNKPRGLVL